MDIGKTFVLLSILKILVTIVGLLVTFYYGLIGLKDKKKLKKAVIAFSVTFVVILILILIEFSIATT